MAVSFTVECVSCHGRLRVTDEALLGTIVACPRCGSMVQISPPPQQPATSQRTAAQPPGSQPRVPQHALVVGNEIVDSQEMTQGDLLDEQELSWPSGSTAATAPPIEPEFAGQPPQTHQAHAAPDDSADWQAAGNWASKPSRQARKRLLIGVAAAGGLILVTMLAAWTLGVTTAPVPVAQQVTTPDELPSESADTTEPPEAEVGQTESSLTDIPPSSAAAEDSNLGEAVPGDSPANKMLTDNGGTPVPSDLLPSDVLTGSIDRGSAESLQAGGDERVILPGANTATEPAPLMDMPAELEAFTQLLDLPGIAPGTPPTQPIPEAADDLLLDEAADAMLDPMLLATAPPEVNIDNALKLRVAIQTKGYPLADFILACSELTQVPIQIDWVTLDLANVSFSQSVRDAKPGWKPIGVLIDTIASELGLVFEREESKLFLTLSEADTEHRLADVQSLDDFGSEQEATKAWVTHFLASMQWNERERLGLRALVTDCLRRARGIPAKLSESSQSHWTATANCLANHREADFPEQWPLFTGGDAGKQLDTAITLAGLLRQTARINRTSCVVNWDDVRQRRLTPGQLVLPFADQPAGEMLTKTLAPMGLQVRVADQSHWWVGTAATYDRMPLLVIGDELGPRREEILGRIRDAAARAGTPLLLEHDPVSDRYLSLMPRFLYRQLPTILKPFRVD